MAAIRSALLLLLLPAAATPVGAHSWYSGLRNSNGIECCGDRDCHSVGLCVLPDGKEGLVIEGTCRPIPWNRVLPIASPDGSAHACWQRFGRPPAVRCVILPGEA